MTSVGGPSGKRLGPIGLRLARAPTWLYRARLGWLLGTRFVLVEHVGRTSGKVRRTVLEVIARDGDTVDVAAAWPASDWLRNLRSNPNAHITSGRRRRLPVTATVLGAEEAEDVFRRYAVRHPRSAEALAKILDLPLDDPKATALAVPVVEFRPS